MWYCGIAHIKAGRACAFSFVPPLELGRHTFIGAALFCMLRHVFAKQLLGAFPARAGR